MNKPVRLAALKALNECGRFLMPQDTLISAVRLQVPEPPTRAEVLGELAAMESDGLVVPGRNPVSDILWKLTAAGQAACSELQM